MNSRKCLNRKIVCKLLGHVLRGPFLPRGPSATRPAKIPEWNSEEMVQNTFGYLCSDSFIS